MDTYIKRELKDFLALYVPQLTVEQYEDFIIDINNEHCCNICELVVALNSLGVDLDKV